MAEYINKGEYCKNYCHNCGAKMGMGRGGENASKEM